MILSAHQPTYLPSISFFSALAAVDVFVLADDFQFTTDAQINRTRIKTAAGTGWLTVPVLTKGRRGQRIKDVRIDTARLWQRKHFKTLQVNYTYSAYFERYVDFFVRYYSVPRKYLLDLNLEFIQLATHELKLTTKVVLSSQVGVRSSGQTKLIRMTRELGCQVYLARPEFVSYLAPEVFKDNGVELKFMSKSHKPYYQMFDGFISDLSIVDLLFNEGEESHKFLGEGK